MFRIFYKRSRFSGPGACFRLCAVIITAALSLVNSVDSFGSGSLTAGDAPAPASADLTATGTSDWIHWGLTGSTSVDRKAGVTAQISALTVVGGVAKRYKAPAGVRVDYIWSDGAPTASANTTTGIYLPGVGNRFELSVPADTTTKSLTLYAGGYKARGRLDFSLSDGSATPTSIFINNPGGPVDREVGISFSAASAGQSLLITYTLLDDNGVGGNITMAGVALAHAPAYAGITVDSTSITIDSTLITVDSTTSANDDLDGDGLANSLELQIGTDVTKGDTDGDGLDDFTEVAYDGDPTAYTQGLDTDPLSIDTDGDGITDQFDPVPLEYNFADGDLAPLGAPDGIINAADFLIARQIVLGLLAPTSLELAHGDVYPPGAPDGNINIQDLILLHQ